MKRYRNVAPVFGIDEDEQQDNNQIVDDDSDASKEVVIQKFLKNPDIIKSFQCQEVREFKIITRQNFTYLYNLGSYEWFNV